MLYQVSDWDYADQPGSYQGLPKRGRKINLILLKILMERKIQVFCSFSLMCFFPTLDSWPFFFSKLYQTISELSALRQGVIIMLLLASHFPVLHVPQKGCTKAHGSWVPSRDLFYLKL